MVYKFILFFVLLVFSTVSNAAYNFWSGDLPDTQGITYFEWSSDGGTTVVTAAMEAGTVAGTVKMVSTPANPGDVLIIRACIATGECGPWSLPVTVLPGQPTVIIQWSN